MRGVLTTLVLAFTFLLVLALNSSVVLADVNDPDPQPEVQGIEIPEDPWVVEPLDEDTNDGDPDDIGGGFRGCEGAPLGNHDDSDMIELEVLLRVIEQLMWRALR